MQTENISLFEPGLGFQEAYYRYCEAFRAANEPPRPLEELAYRDFPAFIQQLRDHAQGLDLPEGFVPYTTFWLVRDGREILGNSTLRHTLNARLENLGGHIGYAIHPLERGKGYATLQLRLVLEKARERGLQRVLITCDTDNSASAQVIRKNGGVLASEEWSNLTGKRLSRYWVELSEKLGR